MTIIRNLGRTAVCVIAGLVVCCPAAAKLPEPVREMIEAARKSGNTETFAAVVAMAKQTNGDDHAEIEAIEQAFSAERQAEVARLAAAKQRELRQAGLFDSWSGDGEIGAFVSSGNSDNAGLAVGLSLAREGIDWTHKLRAKADYQQTDGVTSREQYFASYEPRYQIDKGLFAYGLVQFESDRFQGYTGRYAASGGLGYHVIDGEAVDLSLKAGPAYRRTEFVGGNAESSLAALAAVDFDWRVSDRVSVTQDASMVAEGGGQATIIVGAENTTLNLVSGLDAKLSNVLTTRLSYAVDYNSDPAPGAVSTDTLTRFTLVYDF